MHITDLQAIDVHAHCGVCVGQRNALVNEFMTGDAQTVVERARQARTGLTVVSPLLALLPRRNNDAMAGNQEAVRVVGQTEGLMQWVVVDPLKPKTYQQAEEMLKSPKCAGIKIHPEEHGYPIAERGKAIFSFAARHGAIVITHSGEENSLPADFVPLANGFPEVALILGHLGCGWDSDPTHQVRAIQASKHGNMFVDTSSAQNIIPRLLEWAVREIGADRLLFGTDSPLYFAAMQRARIDHADITDQEKRLILHDNAARLLKLTV